MTKQSYRLLSVILVFASTSFPLFAGDSFWGRVVAVKSPDVVTLNNGSAQIDVRLAGVEVPPDPHDAALAMEFLRSALQGKAARARLHQRGANRVWEGRLIVDDPQMNFMDVGLEMVRSGIARRKAGYDYKYHQLSAAESEARSAQRGLWAPRGKP